MFSIILAMSPPNIFPIDPVFIFTGRQLGRPYDDASAQDFGIRVATSVQHACGFVSVKGSLAESAYRLSVILCNSSCLLPPA